MSRFLYSVAPLLCAVVIVIPATSYLLALGVLGDSKSVALIRNLITPLLQHPLIQPLSRKNRKTGSNGKKWWGAGFSGNYIPPRLSPPAEQVSQPKLIIFFHLPKCAGTAVRQLYQTSDYWGILPYCSGAFCHDPHACGLTRWTMCLHAFHVCVRVSNLYLRPAERQNSICSATSC